MISKCVIYWILFLDLGIESFLMVFIDIFCREMVGFDLVFDIDWLCFLFSSMDEGKVVGKRVLYKNKI